MIYFDNAATTPTLKEATEVFLHANDFCFANPASAHAFGRESAKLLEGARNDILTLLGLEKTHSLIFTSGATESNNLALKGLAFHYQKRGNRILTSNVEHPSITRALDELRGFGFEVVQLPVDSEGKVEPKTLAEMMDKNTILVSLMAVNNEIGSINPLGELADIVHQYPKAIFHVDATQALGKTLFPYEKCDAISFSGHKFGAFKGTGGLLYKKSLVFEPVNAGGEQENGFRAGTVNMPGFVAMAKALQIAIQNLAEREQSVRVLHDYLLQNLLKRDDIVINSPKDGTPYVLNFSLLKKKASVVVEALSENEIYVSTVSACSSEHPFSYVVKALGRSQDEAENTIRLSFSPLNTLEEAQTFLDVFSTIMLGVKDR
jgi:cysteine desulfurase